MRATNDGRRRVRSIVLPVVLVFLGAMSAVGALHIGPPAETTPGRAELHRDGDLVVYAKVSGASAPVATGNGYATYSDATLLEHYTVRLVDSAEVERLRPHLDAVASAMRDQVGQSVSVAGGTVAPGETATGQVDVHVSSTAPCSGAWVGCATPIISKGTIDHAEVWIHPKMFDRSVAALDNTVRHELGHAFGLAHYDAEHDGHVQTMHSSSFDAPAFRTGDLAGLRRLAVHASEPAPEPAPAPTPAATPAPEPAPTPAPSGDPTGDVDVQVSSIGIVVRGHAVDPDSDRPLTVVVTVDDAPSSAVEASRPTPGVGDHGFELVWSVTPGAHTVCVVARNLGPGEDTSLGCQDITVIEGGVGYRGVQTL